MKKAFVNFSLVFVVLTLVVTGVLAFVQPFSITIARTHIVFASLTTILIVVHIFQRYQFFTVSLIKKRHKTRTIIATSIGIFLFFLYASAYNISPIAWLVSQSYEHKRFAEIVRTSPSVFEQFSASEFTLIKTNETCGNGSNHISLQLKMHFSPQIKDKLAIAIWAESTAGSLIESLYLSPNIAYTDTPIWHGNTVKRSDILPIWRNKYTLISGVDGDGKFDQFTGATKNHQFSLQDYLQNKEHDEYIIYAEINIAGDPNASWTNATLGQPSILYSAYISHTPDARQHAILELTGHGGAPNNDGSVQYQFTGDIDAQQWIDLILLSSHPCHKP